MSRQGRESLSIADGVSVNASGLKKQVGFLCELQNRKRRGAMFTSVLYVETGREWYCGDVVQFVRTLTRVPDPTGDDGAKFFCDVRRLFSLATS
jgi:hypothetical protein